MKSQGRVINGKFNTGTRKKLLREDLIDSRLRKEVIKRGGIYMKWGVDGWPDRVVMLPINRTWFLELKSEGKILHKRQAARLRKLHKLGFNTKEIKCEKDYLDVLTEFDLL